MSIDLGLKVHRPGATVDEVMALAETAEQVGFDSIWGFDHLNPIDGQQCLEAYSLLSALATETKQVAVGVLVTSVGYRHPALLANIVATIDRISDGRAELGLGAGSKRLGEKDYRKYGMDFPPYKQRMEKLEEAVEIVQSLWTSSKTNFDGEFYQLERAQCGVEPLQQPHPRITIGGTSRLAISMAVNHGLEVNVSTGPQGELLELPGRLKTVNKRIAEISSNRNRDPETIRRSVQLFIDSGKVSEVSSVVTSLAELGTNRVMLVPSAGIQPEDIPELYESISERLRDFK